VSVCTICRALHFINFHGQSFVSCLQGHIWREGFQSGELKGELFRDVPDALVRWRAQGIKTYIYSSGSREAQKNLFGHTTVGDMRPYLYGFFDTTSGPKVCGDSHHSPCPVSCM
jgi:methylthioribulose 1-phosphate dehydratase/enolase-phosphatase E1